jgi:hypothetical protein
MKRYSKMAVFFFAVGCGPSVDSDDQDEAGDEMGVEDDSAACAEGACPDELSCGEEGNVCIGGLGISPCIDGKCGPAPSACFDHTTKPETCNALCARTGAECSEMACEGVTAFGYPGAPELADGLATICGKNTEEVINGVERHAIGCDEPLPWSDEVALFQCCCDDPLN